MSADIETHPPAGVCLRDLARDDLPALFEHQRDPDANHMAAFTAENPADRDAFMARWRKILADDAITKKAIIVGGAVVGSIVSFRREGVPEVSYWIAKDSWGRGIATSALARFLDLLGVRPLYARVVKDNAASIRVLEKCGFTITGESRGFANARGAEVEEYILRLAE